MKPTLSVVISAYNEEKTIGRCLSSVSFADEIIVIDNSSSDETSNVAKKYTKNVYQQKNNLMLNINKNYGFQKAKSDWILNLDADEEIPEALADEITSRILADSEENGFWIKRKNFSFGKWIQHGLWWPDKQIRLFRRQKGKFPCVHIHEYIKIDGAIGELTEPYTHYNYESIHQYITKIDRASTSEAISLQEVKYALTWKDAFRFPLSDFLKIYFAQGGYKDGLHGLVLAMLQAFYSFCVFAKYWEMQKFPQYDIHPKAVEHELRDRAREMQYWLVTMIIESSTSTIARLQKKIQRRFIRPNHE